MQTVLIIGRQPRPGWFHKSLLPIGFRAWSCDVRLIDFGTVHWHALRALTHRWPATSRPLRRRLHAKLAQQQRADLAPVIGGMQVAEYSDEHAMMGNFWAR